MNRGLPKINATLTAKVIGLSAGARRSRRKKGRGVEDGGREEGREEEGREGDDEEAEKRLDLMFSSSLICIVQSTAKVAPGKNKNNQITGKSMICCR